MEEGEDGTPLPCVEQETAGSRDRAGCASPSPVLLVLVFPTSASLVNIRIYVAFDWLILRHLHQLSSYAIERSRGAGHGLNCP